MNGITVWRKRNSLYCEQMYTMTKPIQIFFAGVLLLAGAQLATAEETRYYDIEVIIFESRDAYDRQAEEWKTDIQRETPQPYVELGQPYPGPIPAGFDPKLSFKPLAKSALRLQQEVKLLEASDRYRILYHNAWRQPGMDAATALPVHIRQSFVQEVSPAARPSATDTDRPPSSLPVPTSAQQTRAELDGYIRLILSRYLHAEVDLMYTTGLAVSSANPGYAGTVLQEEIVPPVVYRLQESRRMRSTEVHYLDHPVLGMIVLVTPYEGK